MSKNYEDYLAPIVVTDFNKDDVFRFRKQLIQETLISKKHPIQVYIDSDGGDIDGLAAMVEIIESIPNPVHTICIGRACSAAAFLLSFGDLRYCGEMSTVMIHKISAGAIGHLEDINNQVYELNRVNELWFERFASNCGLTPGDIDDHFRNIEGREIYLDAIQAKEFGIVDHIGVPQLTVTPRKARRRKSNAKKSKAKATRPRKTT